MLQASAGVIYQKNKVVVPSVGKLFVYEVNMNDKLIKFYTEDGVNNQGLTFHEILDLSNRDLETNHEYIQWLFPTLTPSACVEDSPVLDDETIVTLIGNEKFRHRYHAAIILILNFWNIPCDTTLKIQPLIGNREWASGDNHNLRRIARFLESVTLLRYNDVAKDLFGKLLEYSLTPEGREITKTNIYYWYKSLNV